MDNYCVCEHRSEDHTADFDYISDRIKGDPLEIIVECQRCKCWFKVTYSSPDNYYWGESK